MSIIVGMTVMTVVMIVNTIRSTAVIKEGRFLVFIATNCRIRWLQPWCVNLRFNDVVTTSRRIGLLWPNILHAEANAIESNGWSGDAESKKRRIRMSVAYAFNYTTSTIDVAGYSHVWSTPFNARSLPPI